VDFQQRLMQFPRVEVFRHVEHQHPIEAARREGQMLGISLVYAYSIPVFVPAWGRFSHSHFVLVSLDELA
jgi:hypothetical protein